MVNGELGRKVTLAAEAALKKGRSIKGREILRTIFRYFKTHKTAERSIP